MAIVIVVVAAFCGLFIWQSRSITERVLTRVLLDAGAGQVGLTVEKVSWRQLEITGIRAVFPWGSVRIPTLRVWFSPSTAWSGKAERLWVREPEFELRLVSGLEETAEEGPGAGWQMPPPDAWPFGQTVIEEGKIRFRTEDGRDWMASLSFNAVVDDGDVAVEGRISSVLGGGPFTGRWYADGSDFEVESHDLRIEAGQATDWVGSEGQFEILQDLSWPEAIHAEIQVWIGDSGAWSMELETKGELPINWNAARPVDSRISSIRMTGSGSYGSLSLNGETDRIAGIVDDIGFEAGEVSVAWRDGRGRLGVEVLEVSGENWRIGPAPVALAVEFPFATDGAGGFRAGGENLAVDLEAGEAAPFSWSLEGDWDHWRLRVPRLEISRPLSAEIRHLEILGTGIPAGPPIFNLEFLVSSPAVVEGFSLPETEASGTIRFDEDRFWKMAGSLRGRWEAQVVRPGATGLVSWTAEVDADADRGSMELQARWNDLGVSEEAWSMSGASGETFLWFGPVTWSSVQEWPNRPWPQLVREIAWLLTGRFHAAGARLSVPEFGELESWSLGVQSDENVMEEKIGGTFRLEAERGRAHELEWRRIRLAGESGLVGGRAEGEAALAGADGRVRFSTESVWGEHPEVTGNIVIPAFELGGGDWLKPVFPMMAPYRLEGSAFGNLDLRWRPAGFELAGTLGISAGRFEGVSGNFVLDGIETAVSFTDLIKGATLDGQRLRIGRIEVGKVIIENLTTSIQGTGFDHLTIGGAEGRLWRGRVNTDGFSIDLRDPAVSTVLRLESFEAEDVMVLFPAIDATVRGRFNGVLPVTWTGGSLQLGAGSLNLKDGEFGRLAFSYPGLLTGNVDSGHPAFSTLKRIEEALSELRIRKFDITLFPAEGEGRTARLAIRGDPVDVDVQAPVSIDVNVNAPLEHLIDWGIRAPGFSIR